ncbi:hypothetical protein I4U23_005826 [Adineta vaga]|nr:hypothetical protein I4U23_005826 [Adineta vaga]
MLEYFLSIAFVIVMIFFIIRSKHEESRKTISNKKRSFGKWNPISIEFPPSPPYPYWSIDDTRPLPYRPFKYGPDYFITMGISRLDLNDWIELDNQWTKYHQEKLSRLSSERASHL